MKILAFAGSNSLQSINKKLVKHTATYFSNCEINLLDLNDYEMPLFSVDREKIGFPELVHTFLYQVENCDAIIVSLAEHNRSYSVAFKNILDWCSRLDMNIFKNKPMLLMSTSPGGFGGGNVMNTAKPFFPKCGADVIETFSLPSFYQNFNEETGITHPELKTDHESKIMIFKEKLGIK
jgi:NAD(P)H-dependent FMN reductase